MVDYIDQHKEEFGVEPICTTLQVAPSTYYTAKSREPSERARRDAALLVVLVALHAANFSVYGVHKMWKAMVRAGHDVGRDQVGRLMKVADLRGVRRLKRVRTTRPDPAAPRSPDLVERNFPAEGPNRPWITDLTYVPTWQGVAYVCFITDVFRRRIVGWRVAAHMRTDMVLDALEMARWQRGSDFEELRCHSDAGSQGEFNRSSQHLDEIGARPSIGSVGDGFDNALAESVDALYKTELVRGPGRGPWRTIDELELQTLAWVHWHNTERLHGYLGDVSPAEFEAAYDATVSGSPLMENTA